MRDGSQYLVRAARQLWPAKLKRIRRNTQIVNNTPMHKLIWERRTNIFSPAIFLGDVIIILYPKASRVHEAFTFLDGTSPFFCV